MKTTLAPYELQWTLYGTIQHPMSLYGPIMEPYGLLWPPMTTLWPSVTPLWHSASLWAPYKPEFLAAPKIGAMLRIRSIWQICSDSAPIL